MAAAERSFRLVIWILREEGVKRGHLRPIGVPIQSRTPAKVRKICHSTGIFGPLRMLNEFPTQSGQSCAVWSGQGTGFPVSQQAHPDPDRPMRITPPALLWLPLLAAAPARADPH